MNTFLLRCRLRFAVSATLALAAAGALVACGSMPPPTEQMAVSNAAVTTATNAGATELAPTEWRAAREKLDRAQAAMTAKDYPLALSLAQEVQVDARLAQAKAESAKAAKAAQALQDSGRALQVELDRHQK